MYKQKLHEIQSELAISRMMEKEFSADVDAIQKKYDIYQAAAVLREKDLDEKFSLAVKDLSEKASNNNNIPVSCIMNHENIFYFNKKFEACFH